MCTRLPHIGLTAVAIVYTGSTKLLYLGVFYEVRDRIHMKPNVPVLGATPIKIALSESMQHRWTDSHDILCQRTIKILSTHIFYLDASIIMTTLQKKKIHAFLYACVSASMLCAVPIMVDWSAAAGIRSTILPVLSLEALGVDMRRWWSKKHDNVRDYYAKHRTQYLSYAIRDSQLVPDNTLRGCLLHNLFLPISTLKILIMERLLINTPIFYSCSQ